MSREISWGGAERPIKRERDNIGLQKPVKEIRHGPNGVGVLLPVAEAFNCDNVASSMRQWRVSATASCPSRNDVTVTICRDPLGNERLPFKFPFTKMRFKIFTPINHFFFFFSISSKSFYVPSHVKQAFLNRLMIFELQSPPVLALVATAISWTRRSASCPAGASGLRVRRLAARVA